jgi:hypothetical protein
MKKHFHNLHVVLHFGCPRSCSSGPDSTTFTLSIEALKDKEVLHVHKCSWQDMSVERIYRNRRKLESWGSEKR